MAVRMLVGIAVMLLALSPVSAAQDAAPRAREAYGKAIELEAAGNDAAALALLWQASGAAPRDADIHNRLGEALARMGALEAAVDAFTRALAERPGFQKAANNLVLALVQAGRGGEATSHARRFVASAPDDPDRYFTLGLAQAEQDLDDAIRTFRRVLELAPRHTLARYNLALALQRADRLKEAAEELRRAIAIEPRPEAYYSLGVVRWHQGDLEGAIGALRSAIASDPGYAAAYDTLGAVLKEQRDWSAAAETLRHAIALRPEQPAAYVTLARVLQASGDERGARAQLDQAEKLRRRAQLEHEALVWTAVGTHRLDAADLLGALDAFRRATATFEPYAPAHYQMGRTLQQLGNKEAAQAAFARARQLNPSLVPPLHPP